MNISQKIISIILVINLFTNCVYGQEIEKIRLNNINCKGYLCTSSNNLKYLGKNLCKIYILNSSGKLKKIEKNIFKESDKFNGCIDGYFQSNRNTILINGSLKFFIFNKRYELSDSFYVQWKNNNLKYTEIDMLNYNIKSDTNGNIYIPLFTYNKRLNPLQEEYLKKCPLLVKIDIKKKKIVKVVGKYSSKYKTQKYHPQNFRFSYDINNTNNHFFITYSIDNQIYEFDENFKLISKFGEKGRNINLEYIFLKEFNIKKARKIIKKEYNKAGQYIDIKIFPKDSLIFRTYIKGRNRKTNGLQIYKNHKLIKDIDVPKDFIGIIGKIGDYYYSKSVTRQHTYKTYTYRLKI